MRHSSLGRWARRSLHHPIIAGILALCWLAFRSGTRPNRLAYPCQKAAMSTAALALGIPLTTALVAARHRLLAAFRRPRTLAAVALAVLIAVLGASQIPGVSAYLGRAVFGRPNPAPAYLGAKLAAPTDYRASLYDVTNCEVSPTGDRFLGLDNLVALMGRQGLRFYRSNTASLTSGPDGIIAANDVVIIKINYQWDQRGGTNVDLLAGLIRRIVGHPDGFTGEIVVCENAQFVAAANFDRAENNAQDHARSPHDAVAAFQALGYNVSHYDWTLVRGTSVAEYSAGNTADGYVVGAFDSQVNGRASYPKFRTAAGTYISLRYGIWDPVAQTYDRGHLKFINLPVLKSHGAVYGVTASVKHYMGVVSGLLSTNSHNAIATGILGKVIGEIGPADLNIIDALYINAVPTSGPGTSYSGATTRREIVASRDPIAADIWSVKNILIPAFIANGYSPPWPNPSADPDDSTSTFRRYLDRSMYQMLAAGYTVTNDLAKIDVFTGNGRAGDFDQDADIDSLDYNRFVACYTGPGGGPVAPECAAADFDGDADVDCSDWLSFQFAWTGPGSLPAFTQCTAGIDTPGRDGKSHTGSSLGGAAPNPMKQATAISFSLSTPGKVRLSVVDVSGRVVKMLLDGTRTAGDYSVAWDARNDEGKAVVSGVYFYRLEAPGFADTKKLVISD
jgi:hypothetical protein